MGINELAAYPNRLFSQSLPGVPNINFTYTLLMLPIKFDF